MMYTEHLSNMVIFPANIFNALSANRYYFTMTNSGLQWTISANINESTAIY